MGAALAFNQAGLAGAGGGSCIWFIAMSALPMGSLTGPAPCIQLGLTAGVEGLLD
ncbi:MAG TPA: hypothetical protein VKU00_26340 [Chthonomonadaceae bacterium]|nr:hypothetical protein [Chthonomonadaceae bacterium]